MVPGNRGDLPAKGEGAAPALPGLLPAGANLTISRLLAGGTWNTLSVVVNRLLPNVFVLILAFLVTPSVLGVYSYILASYTVLSLLADLGIAFSLQNFVQDDPEETARIASTALVLRFISSFFLASLCVAADAAWKALRGSGVLVGILLIGSAFGTVLYVLNARLKFKHASRIGHGPDDPVVHPRGRLRLRRRTDRRPDPGVGGFLRPCRGTLHDPGKGPVQRTHFVADGRTASQVRRLHDARVHVRRIDFPDRHPDLVLSGFRDSGRHLSDRFDFRLGPDASQRGPHSSAPAPHQGKPTTIAS